MSDHVITYLYLARLWVRPSRHAEVAHRPWRSTMVTFECPTCHDRTTQPAFVTAAGHECPMRRADRKVSTFVLVTAGQS